MEEQGSHNVSLEHTDPSDLDSDPDNQAMIRPSTMTSSTDQQVPSIAEETLQNSPIDPEEGKRDVRESCEKEAELVQEKAQSSNVDVGAVGSVVSGYHQGESLGSDKCSTSTSDVNAASTV